MLKAVIFDFDGPIFDGRSAAHEAIKSVFEERNIGKEITREEFSQLPLLDPRKIIFNVTTDLDLEKSEFENLLNSYKSRLTDIELKDGHIQPLVSEFLRNAKKYDFKLFVYSNRSSENLEKVLSHHGLIQFLDGYHGLGKKKNLVKSDFHSEQLHSIVNDAKKREIALVGDSDHDYYFAKEMDISYYHAGYSKEPSNDSWKKANEILYDPADLEIFLSCASNEDSVKVRSSDQIHRIPSKLKKAIDQDDLVIYCGAGISIKSGIPNWSKLYKKLIGSGKNILFRKYDQPEVLELLTSKDDMASNIYNAFRKEFRKKSLNNSPNSYHFSLLRIESDHIWTTNYDKFFEQAIEKSGKDYVFIKSDEDILSNLGHEKWFVKMNGDFEETNANKYDDGSIIFTQSHFDSYEEERTEIWRHFEDDFRNKCILFVGTSMNDPALLRILRLARRKVISPSYNHFLLSSVGDDPVKSHFKSYERDNLNKLKIRTLNFDNYSGVEKFVRNIALYSQKPVISFSGNIPPDHSQSETLSGGSLTKGEVEKLCRDLGKELVQENFRVSSGCGPSIGKEAVESGFLIDSSSARFYLRKGGGTKFDANAPAIPVSEDNSNENPYQAMRERFIRESFALIALSGVPYNEDESGTIKEIELAMDKKVPVILFPQSGGDVFEYQRKFVQKIEQKYDHHEDKLRKFNEKIFDMNNEELKRYIRNHFVIDLQKLLSHFMSIPFRDQSSDEINLFKTFW